MIEPLHLKTIEVRNVDIQAARTLLRGLTSVSRLADSRQGCVPERPLPKFRGLFWRHQSCARLSQLTWCRPIPSSFEQTTIARTIRDPARSVLLRRAGGDPAYASARTGDWSRGIDFSAQHFGRTSKTGRSRFKTAGEYYLRREERGSHDCILHNGRSGPGSDVFAARALQHFEERLEEQSGILWPF